MKYILSGFADEAGDSASEQIKSSVENGVGYIELRNMNGRNLTDLPLSEVKEVRNVLDGAGVKVSAAGSPFGKTDIGEDFAPTLELFKAYAEKMRALDTNVLRMFSFYGTLNNPDGYQDEVFRRINLMMNAAPGVVFCHENERGIYGNTPERCKKLYEAFGGRLKLVFDPANFVCDKIDALGAYEMLEDYIEYFHIKDAVMASGEIVPAGRGDAHVAEILRRYSKKGRDVFLSIEPHLKINDKGEGMPVKTKFIYDTKPEAFGAACDAMKRVLAEIGFKPSTEAIDPIGAWGN